MNPTATVSQPVVAVPAGRTVTRAWSRTRHTLRAVLAIGLGVALVAFLVPRVVGSTRHDIVAAFSAVSSRELVVLTALWALGLLTHSFVLTGALPGLSRRRALTLNLTGSAVSNVMPFGGAVGMTLNYYMLRSWQVSPTEFASFTFVTNVWVVLMKLALPGVALAATLATGSVIGHGLGLTAGIAAGALALSAATVVLALAIEPFALAAARWIGRRLAWGARILHRDVTADTVADRILAARDQVVNVVRAHWPQLTAGMTGYTLLQAALLYACLAATGAGVSPVAVLAAFAVERVLTLVVVTPGAVGFTEAGAAAVLVALGGAPAAVGAGVLLYRGYVMALEVPVGGTWLGGWFLTERWRRRRSPIEEAAA